MLLALHSKRDFADVIRIKMFFNGKLSWIIWNRSKVGSVVKNLTASAGDAGDMGLIPRLGKSAGGGNGNPLQYSCLGNPMDRGAWGLCSPGGHQEWRITEWLSTHTHMHPGLSKQTSLIASILKSRELSPAGGRRVMRWKGSQRDSKFEKD